MKDPIKISPEELQATTDLQQKFQQSVLDFGNLYVEKMALEASVKSLTLKESNLIGEWNNLQSKETELINGFFTKYGDGSLDIKRGLFLPKE